MAVGGPSAKNATAIFNATRATRLCRLSTVQAEQPMSQSPDQPQSQTPRQNDQPLVGRRPKRNLAWVWLIPLIAAAIGASIVWREWSTRGPVIEITFRSAAGIEQGKTPVKFRDVIVGSVTGIRLSPDREGVIVTAQLDKDAESLANEKTQFWVVKPTIGVTGVSGLATLLSGAYIEADTDGKDVHAREKSSFVGLEQPPPITSDRPGTHFRLRSPSLGSIEPGTPIYYLRIPVGVVTEYELDPEGNHVDIDIFVDQPYDSFVHGNTRFWNESGIQVGIGPNGLQVQVGSLAALLSSGLSFATFGGHLDLEQDHVFRLFASQQAAKMLPVGPSVPVEMRFDQSTRGLEVGAPIDFHGLHIGIVKRVDLDLDPTTKRFYTRVGATLYPAMLGAAYEHFQAAQPNAADLPKQVEMAIKLGMRAQLQQTSLITGGIYIQLINRPGTPMTTAFEGSLPVQIPTVTSRTIDDIQQQVSDIIDQIQKIPFQQIGQELDETLKEIAALSRNMNEALAPQLSQALIKMQTSLDEFNRLLSSSNEIPAMVGQSVQELEEVLRSTRQFVDELREKPNALLFGEPVRSYSRETLGAENP